MIARFASGGHWEPIIGYSRAVRVGSFVHVAGSTAADNSGHVLFERDPYRQAWQALTTIERALKGVGSSLEDVVRTRIFLKSIGDFEEVARAHREVFSRILPVNTTIAGVTFVAPEMLVEIEAEAIVRQAAEPATAVGEGVSSGSE